MHWELSAELNGHGLFMTSLLVSASRWLCQEARPPSAPGPALSWAPSCAPCSSHLLLPQSLFPSFLSLTWRPPPALTAKEPQAQRLGEAPVRSGGRHLSLV